jgi:LEA14-like dessication related protein
MTLNHHNHIHLLLTAFLVLSSCKGVEDIRFTGIDNVALKGIENNKVNFTADIGVSNPSPVGFKISEVNLKTIADGTFIGTLTTGNPVKIPAHTDTTYRMDFSMELANMLTGASTLYAISRKKQVSVEMRGYIKTRSWFTVKKVDIDETQLINVPSFNR